MKPTLTKFQGSLTTVFGKYNCTQCSARSKRTGSRCLAPAIKNKKVCRMHGGRSSGPTSHEGLIRSSRAKMSHGTATRKIRLEHRKAILALRALEEAALKQGLHFGEKIRGRKPIKDLLLQHVLTYTPTL